MKFLGAIAFAVIGGACVFLGCSSDSDSGFDPSGNWSLKADSAETITSSYANSANNLSVQINVADDPGVANLATPTQITVKYTAATNSVQIGAASFALNSDHYSRFSTTVLQYEFPDIGLNWDGGLSSIPNFSDICQLTETATYTVQINDAATEIQFTPEVAIKFVEMLDGGKACADLMAYEQQLIQSGQWSDALFSQTWVTKGAISVDNLQTLTQVTETIPQVANRDLVTLGTLSYGNPSATTGSAVQFSVMAMSPEMQQLIQRAQQLVATK